MGPGHGAWGTKTVDDVRAAAAFLKTQPTVDGNRVGVMGLSFGGYLTLLALTQTPDVFAAGIDLMGPTDRRRPFSSPSRAVQIGATEEQDPELYRRISPIAGVSALKAPLLIILSDGDRNVAPEHSYRLVDLAPPARQAPRSKDLPGRGAWPGRSRASARLAI